MGSFWPIIQHFENTRCENPASECPSLNADDFILVLQNSLQAEVMKTCGTGRIVCMDDTHGINYNFHLTTVVVIDEFGEGYPTVWCLSETEQTCMY